MRNLTLFVLTVLLISCSAGRNSRSSYPVYTPPSEALYKEIVQMDSIWEDSYNHCKMDIQQQILSENIEFYHDRGGLVTSKAQLMSAYKNNICGQVTRELLKGSIEVYPIKDFGAVEMGYHRFHSIHDTGPDSHYARFIHIWKKEGDQWKITRVISLH